MSNLESLLDQVDDMRDEIIALEQALVRIPTVNTGFMPTGNETEACRYIEKWLSEDSICLLYTSPSPRDLSTSRMPSSA